MKDLPKVTFGLVNCNRLFYLKSCLESLIYCTKDYPNKEIFVVDNASTESGTSEYLQEIKDRGVLVHKEKERDPSNEFAKGLNTICEETSGDFVFLLQADSQFTVKGGWLKEYVNFFTENLELTGSISYDAQRTCRLSQGSYLFPKNQTEFKFIYSKSYHPISGAGEVLYSRKMLEKMYPWHINNLNHEGGGDSETKMLEKIDEVLGKKKITTYLAMPVFPVASAIYTDPRGTNARIRGNKRYGEYWAPKDSYKYYKIWDYKEALELSNERDIPLGIEFTARPIGWKKPLDSQGNWLKNPIRPENCTENDYVTIN